MITTLLIDLDDTLWATSINNKQALEKLYKELAWDRFFSSFSHYYDVYSPINIDLWVAYNDNSIDMQTLSIERMRRPLQSRGIELSDEDCKTYNKLFLKFIQDESLLCPYALEVLAYLKGKYRICILSNGFGEIQYRKLSDTGLATYVDEVILSSDIGINKPNRHIFDYALEKMKAKREEVLMIGDSWCSDIHGASNAGIKSIWYNVKGYELPEDPSTVVPIHIISDLRELKKLL